MRWVVPLMLMGWLSSAGAATPTILVMGDSLSAGYGIKLQAGWVNLLSQRLSAQGYDYSVVNASVSGETSSGARTRFPALLKTHHPAIVILEIGANDGLRGLPVKQMHDNIAEMIREAKASQAAVLLVGIQMPPNYGDTYTQAFKNVYTALAKSMHIRLVPFFLKDVALHDSLMQADNIHPNEQGQPYLLDTVWPQLKPLLAQRH
ncbi:MAG TPA: arylesterase [Steroidobacteraceae bacterium]|nr:arylesterase [Steroidobacteraceae bacterium]